MKQQYLLFVIVYIALAVICVFECSGTYKELIGKWNSYIDSIIYDVKSEHMKYFDEHSVNNSVLAFNKNYVFVNFKGDVKLTDGYITGLGSIHRTTSCSLLVTEERLQLFTTFQTDPLYFNFTGLVKYRNSESDLFLHGHSSSLVVAMVFSMNVATGKDVILEKFHVNDVSNVTVTVEGLSDKGLKKPMQVSTATFLRATMLRLVEKDMRKYIEEQMSTKPLPFDKFDFDQIPSTTEDPDLIEGKPVYSIDDSNAYIDEVFQNAFTLEAHYGKLDPYSLKEDRIENAFLLTDEVENDLEITNGKLLNLNQMKRTGNCSQPILQSSNVSFVCNLGFDTLEMKYSATATFNNSTYKFEIIPVIQNTNIDVKITTNIKNNVAALKSLTIAYIGDVIVKATQVIAEESTKASNLVVTPTRNPFNQTSIIDHFSEVLNNVLEGKCKDVLGYCISRTPVHFVI